MEEKGKEGKGRRKEKKMERTAVLELDLEVNSFHLNLYVIAPVLTPRISPSNFKSITIIKEKESSACEYTRIKGGARYNTN
jgi:hypothetical protein